MNNLSQLTPVKIYSNKNISQKPQEKIYFGGNKDSCQFSKKTDKTDKMRFLSIISRFFNQIKKFLAGLFKLFFKEKNNGNQSVVAVVDNFKKISVDIDGDIDLKRNYFDLSHGEVVCRVINSLSPDSKILRFNAGTKFEFIPTPGAIAIEFGKISETLKNKERIDAVNLSVSRKYHVDTLSKLTGKTITPDNVLDHKEEIRQLLKNPDASDEFKAINRAIEAIEDVTSRGVKVFNSGGNWGPKYINLYNLADGVIASGATDAKGNITPYSANNQSIANFTQGTYAITLLSKGFDLTGSGKSVVTNREVSGGTNIVKLLTGKPLDEVLLVDEMQPRLKDSMLLFRERKEFIEKNPGKKPPQVNIMDFKDYVISTRDYIKLLRESGDNSLEAINKEADILSQGEYISCISAITGEPLIIFNTKDGELYYNPDKSGRKAINKIDGTSFASPTNLANYINKTFNRKIQT